MAPSNCEMIRTIPPSGGGNALSETSVIIRRSAAIGDVLCSTVIADRLIEMGFNVSFQAHPSTHCVLRRHRNLMSVTEPGGFCHVNLDGVYERDPARRVKHFHQMFFDAAQDQLRGRGLELGAPLNLKPSIVVAPHEVEAARVKFQSHPRPWVFVCPRSDSYAARQVPDGIWQATAAKIHGTCFWIGRHPAPPGFIDLKCQHFDNVIWYLSAADLLVSVDTGPLHVAAAMGIPIVALGQSSSPELHLSDQRDFVTIEPKGLTCLNCQQNICPINFHTPPCQNFDPDFVASWVNARLRSIFGDDVGVVISVYRPEVGMLNECLEHILPQVQEVIVVRDEAGQFPRGALQNGKIRYVTKMQHDIGLARKWNYGARQSNGRWLLFLNDDCRMNPSAVQHMRDAMKNNPGTGIVAPLLRYPDGSIYHAGKLRSPGCKGWGHVDHRRYEHTFKDVTELENVCGCCMLVDRKAFFRAGGADEDVYLYTEDDRLCLAIRKEGYRVLFTPHATGVHNEGMSTKKTDRIIEIMTRSNRTFGEKWGGYFEWNANRLPLGDFGYLKA